MAGYSDLSSSVAPKARLVIAEPKVRPVFSIARASGRMRRAATSAYPSGGAPGPLQPHLELPGPIRWLCGP